MRFASEFGELALTFDDVLLVPGYSQVLPAQVNLRTRLIGDIYLNVPVMSAAMDTVSEAQMAIALARLGGIGVIHRNLTSEEQAEEVNKVKRSESGMIVDPLSLRPGATLAEAEALMSRYHISGIPITDENNRLVGILTNRDIRFVVPGGQLISEFMTSGNLVIAPVGTGLEEAKAILHRHRIEKLPLVDADGRLKGLITVKDILGELEKPGRDPRPDFRVARFDAGVQDIRDLKEGMVLEGTVSNVAAFGAFIDLGVHQDGLVHVSEMSNRFIKDPSEAVKAGQIVKVQVLSADALDDCGAVRICGVASLEMQQHPYLEAGD